MKTEIYRKPFPVSTPDSYDGTRLLPVTQSLKHSGASYGYIADSLLSKSDMSYKTIVLPQINCLSKEEREGVRKLSQMGKTLVILGALGNYDETGGRTDDLLEELTGIKVALETENAKSYHMVSNKELLDDLQKVDEDILRAYMEGAFEPLYTLNCCVDADLGNEGQAIAKFDSGEQKPAIVWFKNKKILWFAGIPSRTSAKKNMGITVRNMSHLLFPKLVQWAGDEKPELSVQGWPPDVPMKFTRPVDQRYMSTYEFFPMKGDDFYLGLVVSYFKEPSTVKMILNLPANNKIDEVRELL